MRQRLIGAAVLIAGAVIFIPMLLDEDALQNSFDHDRLNVRPPDPGAVSQTDAIDAEMLERAERGARGELTNQVNDLPSVDAPHRLDSPSTPPPVADSATTAQKVTNPETPENKQNTASMSGPTTAPALPSPTERGNQPHERVATKSPPPPESEPAAWVVQLGVFRDEAAARALEQRVRASGYKAYVDALPSDNGTSYRVRVGPEPRRANAETTRAQLQQLLKLNGFVVPQS